MTTVTIRHISRSVTNTLLRVGGFLFWLIRTGGLLSLFVIAVQWVADRSPLNARYCAAYAGMVLLGWAGSRLCTLARARLKDSNSGAELPAQSTG